MKSTENEVLKILEIKDKLIKNIEIDILSEFKNVENDFDGYKYSFSRNFSIHIRPLTFDEIINILYWYYEIEITDDKEYDLFNLIVEIRDNNTCKDFYDFLFTSSLDSFISDQLEEIMWIKNFQHKEELFLEVNRQV